MGWSIVGLAPALNSPLPIYTSRSRQAPSRCPRTRQCSSSDCSIQRRCTNLEATSPTPTGTGACYKSFHSSQISFLNMYQITGGMRARCRGNRLSMHQRSRYLDVTAGCTSLNEYWNRSERELLPLQVKCHPAQQYWLFTGFTRYNSVYISKQTSHLSTHNIVFTRT